MGRSTSVYFDDECKRIINTMPRTILSKVCQQAVREWDGIAPDDFQLIRSRFLKKEDEKKKINKEYIELEKIYVELKEKEDILEKERFNDFMEVAFKKFKIIEVSDVKELYENYLEYTKKIKTSPFEYLTMKIKGGVSYENY